MADFVTYDWDFGNGLTSTEASPEASYTPGRYTVVLNTELDDGITYQVEKVYYITVIDGDESIVDLAYILYPRSYHYGFNNDHGFGWSENSGSNWIWPISKASIMDYEENGIMYKMVWDLYESKPYIINTRQTAFDGPSYKDKENYDIECTIISPEFTGEQKHYNIMHEETNVQFRPEMYSGVFQNNFSVDVTLLGDSGDTEIETRQDVNLDREITFTYKNRPEQPFKGQQLKIVTSTSEFKFMGYQSYFLSTDRFTKGVEPTDNNSELLLSDLSSWITRSPGMNIDRCGNTLSYTGFSNKQGPDGFSDSASEFSSLIINNGSITNGSIMLMYKKFGGALYDTPQITEDGGAGVITLEDAYVFSNGWKIAYANGNVFANVTITVDLSFDIFDIRLLNNNIDQTTIMSYVNVMEDYLPRY